MIESKVTTAPSKPIQECCMCGDSGFTHELFQCKICHFRSQHRYCSNLYPNSESYRVCNWCLSTEKDNTKEKSQTSSNSTISPNQDRRPKKSNGPIKAQIGGSLQPHLIRYIKKHRSPEVSPPSARKRVVTAGYSEEEKLRRTNSEEISNRKGIKKQVFRNKVRRYKLLDEVSC